MNKDGRFRRMNVWCFVAIKLVRRSVHDIRNPGLRLDKLVLSGAQMFRPDGPAMVSIHHPHFSTYSNTVLKFKK